MTPAQLRATSFSSYPALGREFATEHLALLQRLPMAICPSFLKEILQLDTSFPAERAALRWQCESLMHLAPGQFDTLLAPLAAITLPRELVDSDWINHPAAFITGMTASLWSSGQIDSFRKASSALFATIPERENTASRLTIAVFGTGATPATKTLLTKLRRQGLFLTSLSNQEMSQQIFEAFRAHAEGTSEPYANWYIDGGTPWKNGFETLPNTVTTSYSALAPVRSRALGVMEATVAEGNAGAERMRDRLTATTTDQMNAEVITSDSVLQRFYTELFTESSGPQIFSTSFVQWTGRELARRARPQTLLLRYGQRQRYHSFDESLHASNPDELDPEGSLRDAEMGIYYAWIEMDRITATGKGTFLAWLEGSSQAVLVGRNAPQGAASPSSYTLAQALKAFA